MVDYSKWDHIEVSDDEDDTHPNVDTPSLFRWRHEARVNRMEKAEQDKAVLEKGSTDNRNKLEDTRIQLEKLKEEGTNEEEIKKLTQEFEALEEEHRKWREKEDELDKKERLTPWNVDTLSTEVFQKTIINKYDEKKDEVLTEEEEIDRQKEFVAKHEKDVKKYGMYKRIEDSQQFLIDNTDLVCEHTANYLVIWCIDLVGEGKTNLMHQVAHQTITMQFLLELAKNLNEDPRRCIRPFFSKMKKAEEQYQAAFSDELEGFKGRVIDRAKIRKRRAQELLEEQAKKEEEERKARLGPGGLDPSDVFPTLPVELQKCFETQDIPLLQETIKKMSLDDAKYHIDRCIKSGLWCPQQGANGTAGEEDCASDDEEDTYVDVPQGPDGENGEETFEDTKES